MVFAWLFLAGTCIAVWPEVRYGNVGWHHVVHVRNDCDRTYVCEVSTDVNPERQRVTVGGHKEVEVVTFLDSPSRVFTPKVDCK